MNVIKETITTDEFDERMEEVFRMIKSKLNNCSPSAVTIRIEADTNSTGFLYILSTKIDGDIVEGAPHKKLNNFALMNFSTKVNLHLTKKDIELRVKADMEKERQEKIAGIKNFFSRFIFWTARD